MTAIIYRRNDINRFRTEICRRTVHVFREINILAKHLPFAEKLIRETGKKNWERMSALIECLFQEGEMIILLLTEINRSSILCAEL